MMTPIIIAIAIFIGVNLSGGHHETTVTLLPDEDGKVGAVMVKTQEDSKILDQAYHYVTAKEGTSRLSDIQQTSEARINKEYAELLKAQPAKPSSVLLHFITGTSKLTEESLAIIPQIVEMIKQKSPTEITIIGHADTTGSDELNDNISLERARVVEKILKDNIPSLVGVTVRSFGSKELLIPTGPNVDEPRNRRVEILIL